MRANNDKFIHYLFRVLAYKSAIDLVTNDVDVYNLVAEKYKDEVAQEIKFDNELEGECENT